MSEVRPVLGVADQRRQIRREAARDSRRIDKPLQLEGLEPAEAIADDDPAPGRPADVSATPVERGAEEQQGIAGGQAGHDRLVLVHRSEENTSELQSLMRISYAVFCLTKQKSTHKTTLN